ncbi:MAG: hypothetical protein LUQ38_08005 [Methanotrichaceae archaeon]|nr:hypothetical protein [Methanotrichaceae archaeon]
MNNPFSCLIGLLAIFLTMSLSIVGAQENGSTLLNNTTQKNATLNNSSNLSTINNTLLNVTNPEKLDPVNSINFIISSDPKVRPITSPKINLSSKDFGIQPPRRTPFVINGYARPTLNAFQENQYLLNAAYQSRKVEGTPHGYVTYYN